MGTGSATSGQSAVSGSGQSIRRLKKQANEAAYTQSGGVTQARPVSDSAMQAGLSFQSDYRLPHLVVGQITDATALANCYRVQFEKNVKPLVCVLGSLGAVNTFGAKAVTTLQTGTRVLCAISDGASFGVVLAVIPHQETDAQKGTADQILHATRNRVDEGHINPLRMPGNGHVIDWLGSAPFDETTVGEQGWMAETGMRIWMDPFMAMLGLDEATSVTAFYHDQLLRIAAYNLRMFTAGSEREAIDDQAEYNDWVGYTPYPWEQMGFFKHEDRRREYPPEVWQLEDGEPWYGPWEPKDDNQRPWHRVMHYQGYFGQGGRRVLCTQPVSPPPFAKFDPEQPQYPCLFDESILMDGRLMLASAKGISITKRMGLITPARKYVPEQIKTEGDSTEDNYKASSQFGSGPDHEIVGELEVPGDPPELIRAAGLHDLHAYFFNYANFHGTWWHEKDYDHPEQSELQHLGGRFFTIPNFSELADKTWLEAPEPKKVKIDERYTESDYYQNAAGIDFLEDGGVVIYDGFGGEIRMTAGSVTISAPGDVAIKPGRTAIMWGGDDVVIRAKNSMDLTVTEKDLRLKAEKNLHVLAGNSGIGGLLLESRGYSTYDFTGTGEDVVSGGVMLRAEIAEVVAWAPKIYMRTGGGDIIPGPIVLDADRGAQQIITHCQSFTNYVTGAVTMNWGTEGDIRKTSVFTEAGTLLPGQFFTDGNVTAAQSVVAGTSLFAAGGHVVTTDGCSNPFVGCLKDPYLTEIRDIISAQQGEVNEDQPDAYEKIYQDIMERLFYDTDKPGNDDVIRNAEFSLRSIEQYSTENFKMWEDRWQQLGRISGTANVKWVEKPVESRPDPETYPWPGKENFIQSDKFFQQDFKMFDPAQGRDKDRGKSPGLSGDYKEPKYEEPDGSVTLKDGYTVIR